MAYFCKAQRPSPRQTNSYLVCMALVHLGEGLRYSEQWLCHGVHILTLNDHNSLIRPPNAIILVSTES